MNDVANNLGPLSLHHLTVTPSYNCIDSSTNRRLNLQILPQLLTRSLYCFVPFFYWLQFCAFCVLHIHVPLFACTLILFRIFIVLL